MPADRRLNVFICYASQDKSTVLALYDVLKTESWIEPWLDKAKILPGQDWTIVIEKAVEESDLVIVCLSKQSVSKEGFVQREIRYAFNIALEKPEETIFLVPLRLEECDVPRSLRNLQYVDYFGEGQRFNYQKLLDAMKSRAQSLKIDVDGPSGKNKEVSRIDSISIGGIELIHILKGEFIMGSNEDEKEQPQHTVEIPYDYWIGRFPITKIQYYQFVKKKFGRDKENHPVVNVSWYDAQKYLSWLNKNFNTQLPKGTVFRLPSETEWEKAARGVDGHFYPWGSVFDKNKCNWLDGGKSSTTPVGIYSPEGDSPYGCADMSGNVWEWTRSLWGTDWSVPKFGYPYNAEDGRENEGETKKVYRVLRGGSFENIVRLMRCSYRLGFEPDHRDYYFGFRVALTHSFIGAIQPEDNFYLQ